MQGAKLLLVNKLTKTGRRVGFFFLLLFSSCDATVVDPSLTRGFSASSGSKNVAVLMSGSGEQHIPKNVGMMREVISDPNAGYNFTIVEKQLVSADQAVQITSDAARQVGEGGTLFWYFSSHGGPDGSLRTTSRMLKLRQITEGIKSARGGVPLKRLVVVVQACYSGQVVNGSAKIESHNSDSGTQNVAGDLPDQFLRELVSDDAGSIKKSTQVGSSHGNLAEQLLVMSASSKSEMSMYSGDGSHFTKALHKTFKQLDTSPQTSMKEFLEQVQKNVKSSRPQYRAEPEDVILQEPLRQTMGSSQRSIYALLNDRSELWVRGVEPLEEVDFCQGFSLAAAKSCTGASKGAKSGNMHFTYLNIPNGANELFVRIQGRVITTKAPVSQVVRLGRKTGKL